MSSSNSQPDKLVRQIDFPQREANGPFILATVLLIPVPLWLLYLGIKEIGENGAAAFQFILAALIPLGVMGAFMWYRIKGTNRPSLMFYQDKLIFRRGKNVEEIPVSEIVGLSHGFRRVYDAYIFFGWRIYRKGKPPLTIPTFRVRSSEVDATLQKTVNEIVLSPLLRRLALGDTLTFGESNLTLKELTFRTRVYPLDKLKIENEFPILKVRINFLTAEEIPIWGDTGVSLGGFVNWTAENTYLFAALIESAKQLREQKPKVSA